MACDPVIVKFLDNLANKVTATTDKEIEKANEAHEKNIKRIKSDQVQVLINKIIMLVKEGVIEKKDAESYLGTDVYTKTVKKLNNDYDNPCGRSGSRIGTC